MLRRISIGTCIAMVGILCLALSVSQGSESRFPTATGETGPAGLSRFYQQDVQWSRCAPGYCTWIRVPLDYAVPDGPAIKLRVKMRLGQGGPGARTLVVNPGGPGGSGVEFVDVLTPQLPPAIRKVYDVVGFDPRGVGQSTPVSCLSSRRLGALLDVDPDPDSDKEASAFRRAYRGLGHGCETRSPRVAAHVSTSEVVRDLDVIRAVLGQQKLDFYGASYGTTIGARYADRAPRRVGRVVLDGALDPSVGRRAAGLAQAKALQKSLRAYLKDCVAQQGCPLGIDRDRAEDELRSLLDQIDHQPLEVAGERELTKASALHGIMAALYDPESWPTLSAAIKRAIYDDGTYLLALADRYFRRGPDGSVSNNFYEAGEAVRCLDDPRGVGDLDELEQRYAEVSPVFGPSVAWSTQECVSWPFDAPKDRRFGGAVGAPTILVVGTTRDPATPYSAARSLAAGLKNGVLLTRDGDGHTGYLMGNTCVDRVVDRFLLGRPPAGDVKCRSDQA